MIPVSHLSFPKKNPSCINCHSSESRGQMGKATNAPLARWEGLAGWHWGGVSQLTKIWEATTSTNQQFVAGKTRGCWDDENHEFSQAFFGTSHMFFWQRCFKNFTHSLSFTTTTCKKSRNCPFQHLKSIHANMSLETESSSQSLPIMVRDFRSPQPPNRSPSVGTSTFWYNSQLASSRIHGVGPRHRDFSLLCSSMDTFSPLLGQPSPWRVLTLGIWRKLVKLVVCWPVFFANRNAWPGIHPGSDLPQDAIVACMKIELKKSLTFKMKSWWSPLTGRGQHLTDACRLISSPEINGKLCRQKIKQNFADRAVI